MIREFHLADWFTLANAVCGTGAMFSMLTYLQTIDVLHVYFACGLVVAGVVFDVLDGRIARWRQKTSGMGLELDSLADVISFGVAPAVIGYGCGMQGLYDRIVLTYFVACGVSRLARYNITAEALSEGKGKVKYFEGTPITTSVLLVHGDVRGCLTGRIARVPLVWTGRCCRLHASSTGPVIRGLRLIHDQPHTDSKVLSGSQACLSPIRGAFHHPF